MEAFLAALAELPTGYVRGQYRGASYGVTVERLADGRQIKLYAEALAGVDHVSFNLYLLASGKVLLKPCEMPEQKVMAFVLGVEVAG